ncbi:nucleotidyltransferase domain-containing protein [Bacillus norwichensis]|uniref:Nucleotidyltransferase domain-containing protein n=1 Tax=Bacillus norwichensis TaxID=2762217 RepID=A0ABR8VJL2_9BACI|nr:nucleotidyltransferase domain-containing protein [Bacillus norwichensis]MBD8004966.1 nucleotidyltransferase domain-containing protein [Bacillus norwichensis]
MEFPTRIGVDNDGYILNATSLDKVNCAYKELLNQVIEILKKCAGAKLHSVYLYGSVGRGQAVFGTSDIDLSVIVTSPFTPQEAALLNEENRKFISENPIVPKVDYDIGMMDEVFQDNSQYYWGFWLKHVCICIYGEDLSIHFPKMKPNFQICRALNQDLIDTLNRSRKEMNEGEVDNHQLLSVLKRIVRGAYCYVAEKDESWSTSIQENLQILQHYFPGEINFKKMKGAFLHKKIPTVNEVLNYIDYFIDWFNEKTMERSN